MKTIIVVDLRCESAFTEVISRSQSCHHHFIVAGCTSSLPRFEHCTLVNDIECVSLSALTHDVVSRVVLHLHVNQSLTKWRLGLR